MFSGHSNARIGRPSRLRPSALRYSDPLWMTSMSRCSASMSKNCRLIRALNRRRKISRRTPCSKQDLHHQNRTSQGLSTALESILHRPGEGARTAYRVPAACRVESLPSSVPEQASWPGLLEPFQAFGASCYDGSSTRRYSRKFPAREHTSLASFQRASFPFRAPSICRLAVVRRFEWIERSIRTSWR